MGLSKKNKRGWISARRKIKDSLSVFAVVSWGFVLTWLAYILLTRFIA
jgi:hypothetical protein